MSIIFLPTSKIVPTPDIISDITLSSNVINVANNNNTTKKVIQVMDDFMTAYENQLEP